MSQLLNTIVNGGNPDDLAILADYLDEQDAPIAATYLRAYLTARTEMLVAWHTVMSRRLPAPLADVPLPVRGETWQYDAAGYANNLPNVLLLALADQLLRRRGQSWDYWRSALLLQVLQETPGAIKLRAGQRSGWVWTIGLMVATQQSVWQARGPRTVCDYMHRHLIGGSAYVSPFDYITIAMGTWPRRWQPKGWLAVRAACVRPRQLPGSTGETLASVMAKAELPLKEIS